MRTVIGDGRITDVDEKAMVKDANVCCGEDETAHHVKVDTLHKNEVFL